MRPFFFALPLGALLDLLLGDPRWTLPHPVVLMGRAIAFLEKIFRRLLPKPLGESWREAHCWPFACPWDHGGSPFCFCGRWG